jgi:hypothetical protein
MRNVLISLTLLTILTGCDALTRTEYDYYPIPATLLEECALPPKPTTPRETTSSEAHARVCVTQGNDAKSDIKAKIDGGIW